MIWGKVEGLFFFLHRETIWWWSLMAPNCRRKCQQGKSWRSTGPGIWFSCSLCSLTDIKERYVNWQGKPWRGWYLFVSYRFSSVSYLASSLDIYLSVYLSVLACLLSHFSHVRLFATPWIIVHQASLSRGFSRQEYWSGLPCPPPRGLSDPRIKPCVHCTQILYRWATRKPCMLSLWNYQCKFQL